MSKSYTLFNWGHIERIHIYTGQDDMDASDAYEVFPRKGKLHFTHLSHNERIDERYRYRKKQEVYVRLFITAEGSSEEVKIDIGCHKGQIFIINSDVNGWNETEPLFKAP